MADEALKVSGQASTRADELGRMTREAAEEAKRLALEATSRSEETSAEALRAAQESKQLLREATEAAVKAASDNVIASAKVLQEAIAKAEETTKAARKLRTAMKVFKDVAASAEGGAQPEPEPAEAPVRRFVDAMSRLDVEEAKAKPAMPRDNRPDIHSRLQFLAKMYATDKDQPFSKSDTPREDE
jgi:hypothetical protein